MAMAPLLVLVGVGMFLVLAVIVLVAALYQLDRHAKEQNQRLRELLCSSTPNFTHGLVLPKEALSRLSQSQRCHNCGMRRRPSSSSLPPTWTHLISGHEKFVRNSKQVLSYVKSLQKNPSKALEDAKKQVSGFFRFPSKQKDFVGGMREDKKPVMDTSNSHCDHGYCKVQPSLNTENSGGRGGLNGGESTMKSASSSSSSSSSSPAHLQEVLPNGSDADGVPMRRLVLEILMSQSASIKGKEVSNASGVRLKLETNTKVAEHTEDPPTTPNLVFEVDTCHSSKEDLKDDFRERVIPSNYLRAISDKTSVIGGNTSTIRDGDMAIASRDFAHSNVTSDAISMLNGVASSLDGLSSLKIRFLNGNSEIEQCEKKSLGSSSSLSELNIEFDYPNGATSGHKSITGEMVGTRSYFEVYNPALSKVPSFAEGSNPTHKKHEENEFHEKKNDKRGKKKKNGKMQKMKSPASTIMLDAEEIGKILREASGQTEAVKETEIGCICGTSKGGIHSSSCPYPFTSSSSMLQRKIKEQYDELVRSFAAKTLSLAQVGRFTTCLLEAKATLQKKSETIRRKFTISKSLLTKADQSSFDRICGQIYKLEIEQKKLEEDTVVYNRLQEQLKLSPAYQKMLEYGRAHFEIHPSTGQMIEKLEAEDLEMSFEELLEQEKKDSFWKKYRSAKSSVRGV